MFPNASELLFSASVKPLGWRGLLFLQLRKKGPLGVPGSSWSGERGVGRVACELSPIARPSALLIVSPEW